MCLMYSYSQDRHLVVKMTHTADVLGVHDNAYAILLQIPLPKMRRL
jgi:hypothetical protein